MYRALPAIRRRCAILVRQPQAGRPRRRSECEQIHTDFRSVPRIPHMTAYGRIGREHHTLLSTPYGEKKPDAHVGLFHDTCIQVRAGGTGFGTQSGAVRFPDRCGRMCRAPGMSGDAPAEKGAAGLAHRSLASDAPAEKGAAGLAYRGLASGHGRAERGREATRPGRPPAVRPWACVRTAACRPYRCGRRSCRFAWRRRAPHRPCGRGSQSPFRRRGTMPRRD